MMEPKLKHVSVPSSEITPQKVYLSRRDFLKTAGIASTAAFLAACGVKLPSTAGNGTGSVTPTLTQSPPAAIPCRVNWVEFMQHSSTIWM
jgi:hypothetical protein